MKNCKKLAILASYVGLSVLLAGASACSMFIPLFSDDSNDSGSGSCSSDGVSGTYSFDVTVYDPAWSDNVVDSSLWIVTATVGAYATDPLVLNEDGTYELTKEMGATKRLLKGGVERMTSASTVIHITVHIWQTAQR